MAARFETDRAFADLETIALGGIDAIHHVPQQEADQEHAEHAPAEGVAHPQRARQRHEQHRPQLQLAQPRQPQPKPNWLTAQSSSKPNRS